MKRPALWLALFLFLLTAAFLFYRIVWLGYPVFPTAPGKTWQLAINILVMSETGEARVLLGLPTEDPGRMVVEERYSSGTLNLGLTREGPNRIGIWSGPVGLEGQETAYRATILIRPRQGPPERPPGIGPYRDRFKREETALAERLAGRWKGLPPSDLIRAIAATAKGEWKNPPPEMKDLEVWRDLGRTHGREGALLLLLRAANLPARLAEGIPLAEGTADYSGKEMETAPRTIANTRLTYTPEALNNGHVSLEWVNLGSYWMDAANTQKYAGHDLYNARFMYAVRDNLEISASVMNLTDERYAESSNYTTSSGRQFAPGLPRTAYAGVRYYWY